MSTPLADVTDVQNRLPFTMSSEQQTRAATLLVDASSQVRKYTRQEFTLETTTERIRPQNGSLVLPQRPVISFNSVARVDPLGTGVIPYSVWSDNGVDTIYVAPINQIVNAPIIFAELSWIYRSVMYEVNYTHGYETIPDDVVGVTAGAVARLISTDDTGPGVVGVTMGGLAMRFVDGYRPGLVSLTPEDKEILKTYRGRRTRTVEMGS